jgi:hypothetical protein
MVGSGNYAPVDQLCCDEFKVFAQGGSCTGDQIDVPGRNTERISRKKRGMNG